MRYWMKPEVRAQRDAEAASGEPIVINVAALLDEPLPTPEELAAMTPDYEPVSVARLEDVE